ncbi:DUF4912 domain-containing protein [Archangium sp.]|uniref:DUF4912 domain-containing protein n=1 Tax=Archangium sp. TaxID=1872627 RepID=UPI00286A0E04|nr:DUF4912 domain-containing protein [Archangium sp.]
MADLKSVTVEYLRELARKHLGRGHSKLKTKEELLGALAKLVPGLGKRAGGEEPKAAEPKAGESKVAKKAKAEEPVGRARAASKKVRETVQQVREKVRGSRKAPGAISAASRTEKPEDPPKPPAAPARPLPGDDDEKTPVRIPPQPAEVVTFPPKRKSGRFSDDPDNEPTLTAPPDVPEPAMPVDPVAPPAPAHVEQHAAEPLVEGFFVARVAGEQEVWRHHLTESQGPRPREALGSPDYHENLGELPLDYENDTVLLLPRDPFTLFLLWDFSPAARERALDGLKSPRAVLRVYDDSDVLVRVIDVALESRSYYIHGLPPGHPYRVEVHFVGDDGRSRRIGHSSNRVFLPPMGPSSDTSVRFLRMPPVPVKTASMAAVAATAPLRTADLEEREYITWRRVALPGSEGFVDLPSSHRERLIPGAPGEGSSEQAYWEGLRPIGSSEQVAGLRPPGGSSEHWAGLRPAGGASSEQWAGVHPTGGSAEQWAWSWTRPTGGASEIRTWATSPSGRGR